MDVRLTDEQELLRRSIREFAEAELRPHVREWDEAQQFPPALLSKFAELGLMGIQFPESYGGAEMSSVDYCLCIEELARVDPSVCLSVAAHNGLGAAHIFMFGTEAQKQQYLVPLAKGEKLAAWGLTEASSGSDAASMQTRAVRDGDSWVINGTKQFITHGKTGDIMVVMAVTTRAKGSRGISAFIVERGTPGFRAGKKEDKLGMRASETSEVIFENCRVPASQLLGTEGQGFINALQVLDAGRIGIAALAVGLAQGSYEAARNYAFERKQFGQPIGTFQSIRAKLVDAAIRIEAARLLTYRAAAMKTEGSAPRSKRQWPSSIRARLRCVSPRTGCRFTAATASSRITSPRSTSATSSSRPSERARARSSVSSSPGNCCKWGRLPTPCPRAYSPVTRARSPVRSRWWKTMPTRVVS
jgi:alkylation response protein AidB-like acyl-CoA dehydrogenase